MKTFIIGYTDQNFLNPSKRFDSLSGHDSAKQGQIMEDASRRHVYPDGIKAVQQFAYDDSEPVQSAAFISDDAAKYAQAGDASRQKKVDDERRVQKLAREAADFISTARKVFDAARDKRNQAIADVAAQKNILSSNQKANAGDLLEKDRPAIIAKIEKLQPLADAAANEFQPVLAAFNIVKNPKSTPDEIEKALIDLGLKKAPTQ